MQVYKGMQSRGNDTRNYDERPRQRTRIDRRNFRVLPYCLSDGCPCRKQTAAWCQGFCRRHARLHGFSVTDTPDPESDSEDEEAEEEIAPPGIPVPSNAIQILAQILGSPSLFRSATVEQRFSSTLSKKAEVVKGSHPQTPLTHQAPDEETRATMSDPAAIQQASKKKSRD